MGGVRFIDMETTEDPMFLRGGAQYFFSKKFFRNFLVLPEKNWGKKHGCLNEPRYIVLHAISCFSISGTTIGAFLLNGQNASMYVGIALARHEKMFCDPLS